MHVYNIGPVGRKYLSGVCDDVGSGEAYCAAYVIAFDHCASYCEAVAEHCPRCIYVAAGYGFANECAARQFLAAVAGIDAKYLCIAAVCDVGGIEAVVAYTVVEAHDEAVDAEAHTECIEEWPGVHAEHAAVEKLHIYRHSEVLAYEFALDLDRCYQWHCLAANKLAWVGVESEYYWIAAGLERLLFESVEYRAVPEVDTVEHADRSNCSHYLRANSR